MSLIEVDEEDVLFEIEGNKIVDYSVETFSNGFRVYWTGSKGFGSFSYYDKGKLDTEYMGRDFCIKFIRKIFESCEVEYKEADTND